MNQINRNLTIPFPIEKVKTSIEVVVAKSTGTYIIKNKNEVLNTYNITMAGAALIFAHCIIQLKKIGENETQFILDTTDTREDSMRVSNDTVDKFINKMTESLSKGEVMTPELQKKGKSGCMIILIVAVPGLIALAASLI